MVEHQRSHQPVEDRGVHTAPFYVLIGANMPSVLAEIAFLSNPDDEKRLKAPTPARSSPGASCAACATTSSP